jgi:hypothetical protein
MMSPDVSLAGVMTSKLMPTKLFNAIFTPDQKQLLAREYFPQEGIANL